MSIFCVVVHLLCVLYMPQNSYLAFSGQGLAFFGEDMLATLPWSQNRSGGLTIHYTRGGQFSSLRDLI